MGDYSRSPTARLLDAVANHYVGVRLQQGVPILDTDWNELEDLRRHELASLFQRFFGDGVPEGTDGFRAEALAGGGAGTLVLEAATVPVTGVSSVEIDFDQSTAASLLGFLPAMGSTERPAANPARLVGNGTGPFTLSDGLTLAVAVNGAAAGVVTFAAADFADIAQATAAEVVAVLNAGLAGVAASTGDGNDFLIRGGDGTLDGAGRLLVEGVEAVNEGDLAFTSQALYENPELAAAWGVPVVPALSTPAGADRTDLVYLDVWDREVDAGEDDGMVVPAVGIEATVRLRREWAVRVAEGVTELAGVARLPGHRYGALALLRRTDGADALEAGAFTDLRVRNLNVARYLKTPIDFRRGAETVDVERFAGMLELLREVLLMRLHNRVFDFAYVADNRYDESLVLGAVRDLALQSAFGAVQARAGNFNNADGLRFLDTLYGVQSSVVQVVETYGNDGGSAQSFIDGYRDRLDPGGAIPGLRSALDDGDFLGSVEAQEEINAWLSAPVDILPEGDLVITLESIEPTTDLAFNVPFNVTYRIRSELVSPQAQEAIDLVLETVSSSTWALSLNRTQVVLTASGGEDTVTATVTPRSGTVSAVFRLTATAARNPLVSQPHLSDTFTVGDPPPADQFLQWSGPPLDGEGRFAITQANLADGSAPFQVDVVNTSDADQQRFELTHFVTPPAGQETLWSPVAGAPGTAHVDVDPGTTETVLSTVNGPSGAAVDSAGTLTVEATLIQENGTSVVGGKSRTLTIPFVVTA